jgi:hypothetical protein
MNQAGSQEKRGHTYVYNNRSHKKIKTNKQKKQKKTKKQKNKKTRKQKNKKTKKQKNKKTKKQKTQLKKAPSIVFTPLAWGFVWWTTRSGVRTEARLMTGDTSARNTEDGENLFS